MVMVREPVPAIPSASTGVAEARFAHTRTRVGVRPSSREAMKPARTLPSVLGAQTRLQLTACRLFKSWARFPQGRRDPLCGERGRDPSAQEGPPTDVRTAVLTSAHAKPFLPH